ncbi:MAG: VCBS repeat-containing protein [Gammaproteobacteria bacterium]|nr:VCBS repeat-containing protein [Gammaproteobacteria bacterium]
MNKQTAIAGDGGKGKAATAPVGNRRIQAGLTGAALVLVAGVALGDGFDLAPEMENSDALLVREFDGTPLDLNNDGIVDLVVGNIAGDSRIYFGVGDGTFTESAATLSTALTTRDLDGGDINGDGFLDIVQANNGQVNNYFLGDGAGNFGAAVAIGAEIEDSASIELADMNGDDLLDVVVGNSDNAQVNRVYPNTTAAGVVSFGPPVDITADTDFTRHLEVGDLDGDGDLDVVAANDDRTGCAACGDAPTKYYLNTLDPPSGTFGFAPGVALAQALESVDDLELVDLDNDTDLDLVKVTFNTVNRFFLNRLIEDGTFTFDAGTDISADVARSNAVEVVDIDGDGDPDVIVGNGNTAPVTGEINRLYLNQFVESGNTTVSFDVGQDITTDAFVTRDIVSIDLDMTGSPDVITAERLMRNRVYLGNGTATPFVNVAPEFTSTPVTTATVDVVYTYDITAEDPDAEDVGEALTITDDGNLPAWLALTDNGDGTATLTGTPTAADIGDVDVTLTVTNTVDSTTSDQMFTITVSDAPVGAAPTFTSTPITNATADVAYSYEITATDADAGDSLVITAVGTLPGWLTLTDNGDGTATLAGTPTAADVGDHMVSLQVSDGTNTDTQDFTIVVAAAGSGNTPPEFTSTPVTEGTVDEAYSYSVTATDAEDDTLTIESITLPAWLTLTDNGDGTATLAGTPAAADVGAHDVSLSVSDGTAAPVLQNFTVTVEEADEPPPPPPPPGPAPTPPRRDGGGGALGLWSFLALLSMSGAAVRRRRR